MTRAWLAWSSGKDSAWALHGSHLEIGGDLEIVGLFTTIDEASSRVGMHHVHRRLVEAQAEAVGLPLRIVELPWPCSNEVYEARLGGLWDAAQREGVEVIAYGDLFLEDIRAYRERQLAGTGLEPRFPLWGRDTGELAVEMIDGGLEAIVVTVDRQCLAPDFVGRAFDRDFLRDLPADVDPCGENGEFHTFVYDSPQFDQPLATSVGDHRRDDRFAWVDLSVDRLD